MQKLITQTNMTKKFHFHMDFCKAMLSVNIPLNILSNKAIKQFLDSYINIVNDILTRDHVTKILVIFFLIFYTFNKIKSYTINCIYEHF